MRKPPQLHHRSLCWYHSRRDAGVINMIDVPDQPLNPPEPRCPDYNDYMEHEQDRLIDEEKEKTK